MPENYSQSKPTITKQMTVLFGVGWEIQFPLRMPMHLSEEYVIRVISSWNLGLFFFFSFPERAEHFFCKVNSKLG